MVSLQQANRHRKADHKLQRGLNHSQSNLPIPQHPYRLADPPRQLPTPSNSSRASSPIPDSLFDPFPPPEPEDESEREDADPQSSTHLYTPIEDDRQPLVTPDPLGNILYEPDPEREPPEPPEPADNDDLAPGFQESPAVRLLYLQATIGNIFGSRTVLDSNNSLNDGLDLIELASSMEHTATHMIKPATTLATAKRRLGLEVDDYIEKQPICTLCYKYYSPADIKALESPNCTVKKCKGIVYRVKRRAEDQENDSEEIENRIPAKILPYISLIKSLKRMLLRSSFVNNLVPYNKHYVAENNKKMFDIQDSPPYNALKIGLKRVVDEDGSVCDVEETLGSSKLISGVDVGLSLTINMDW